MSGPAITASFWMVARSPRGPHTKTAPTQRYSTRAVALRAAQALADESGEMFVLLAAVETVRPGDTAPGLFGGGRR